MQAIELHPAVRAKALPPRDFTHRTPPPPLTPVGGRPSGVPDERQHHYQTIGDTLLVCEASCLKVGIPLLLPTRAVRERAARMNAPFSEYFRTSLATANTHILESYCEDLANLPEDPAASAELFVPPPSYADRYAFPTAVSFVTFVITFLGGLLYLGQTVTLSSMAGALVALFFLFAGLFLVDEKTRRESFQHLLRAEISRRQGGGGSAIPISLMTPQVK